MKRAMFGKTAMVGLLTVAALVACSPTPPQRAEAARAGTPSGWSRPPRIESVRRVQASLVLRGLAEPDARVVLRSDSGAAYAAVADADGRFEIRMAAPEDHLLLRPETQVGQDSAVAPGRLLILAGGRGPIAVLRAGTSTRRLDSAAALGAVDSDGGGHLASGRSANPAVPVEVTAAGETMQVTPDGAGQWTVRLTPGSGPQAIRVGGRDFAWPGPGAAGEALVVERAGQGWRVGWAGPAGARQSTWLPDAAG